MCCNGSSGAAAAAAVVARSSPLTLAALGPLAPVVPVVAVPVVPSLASMAATRDATGWPPDEVLERAAHGEFHGTACPYPQSVLDFLQLRGVDTVAVEEAWPCEVRTFWVRDMQPFVAGVRFIYAYFTLPVVLTGMLLNCFALRVWSSRAMRGTSIAVYLRALSLSDMGALLCTYFLGYWRAHHTAFNTLFLSSETVCRLHKVLVSMFPMTSQWLQTALTVERLLVVWRPLRARNPAYPKVAVRAARRTVAFVYATLILVAFTKWHFSGFEQYSAFDYARCDYKSHSSVVAVYVYVALSTYLPGTIIFVSNVLLFLRLRHSDSLRRSLFAGSAHANDGALYNSDTAARTLVLFSLLYLLLQLPLGIVETVELYWDVTLYRRPPSAAETGVDFVAKREAYIFWLCRKLQLKWSRSLLFWLFQLSFVLNFVVYLKSGGRFRAVAKDLAWRWLGQLSGSQVVRVCRTASRSLKGRLRRGRRAGRAGPATATTDTAPPTPDPEDPEDPEAQRPILLISASGSGGSTGSFSSDSSGGVPNSPDGLGLCWRGPRQRSRTNSCPHRYALRRASRASSRVSPTTSPARSPGRSSCRSPRRHSPCRPCRRARIYTWAAFIRSQGLSLPRRVGASVSGRRETLLSSSLSPLTASSTDGDADVFDTPPRAASARLFDGDLEGSGRGDPELRDILAGGEPFFSDTPLLLRPQDAARAGGVSPTNRLDDRDLLSLSPDATLRFMSEPFR